MINQEAGGGATVFAKEVARLLEEWGDEAKYFPPQGGQSREELLQALEEFQPHILHLHCFYNSYPYAILGELAAKYPAVFTLHDCFPLNQIHTHCWNCERSNWCFPCPIVGLRRKIRVFKDRIIKKRLHRRIQIVLVTPSRWLMEKVKRTEMGRFPIHCIYYGIDLDRFRKREGSRTGLNLPEEAPILLYVGSMYAPGDFRKGLPFLLQAMEDIRKRVPGVILLIVGQVFGIGEEKGIRVFGRLEEGKMPDFFSAADLYVNPTLAETGGITNIEAAACSIAVVSTTSTSVPEYVEHGKTGLLVPPGDPVGLAGAVVKLLQNPSLRRDMGERARKMAEERFNSVDQVKRYREVFLGVLEK